MALRPLRSHGGRVYAHRRPAEELDVGHGRGPVPAVLEAEGGAMNCLLGFFATRRHWITWVIALLWFLLGAWSIAVGDDALNTGIRLATGALFVLGGFSERRNRANVECLAKSQYERGWAACTRFFALHTADGAAKRSFEKTAAMWEQRADERMRGTR